MSLLETRDLKVGYGSKTILKGISLQICPGQVICLLGPNGSGKTTLLRTIAGSLAPLGGTVWLTGRDLQTFQAAELARQLAILPTGQVAPGLLTVFQLASLGRYSHTGLFGKLSKTDIAKTWEVLDLIGARPIAERFFHELSDGEKQKALLARALVQEPQLLVLDEPTSFLDLRHRIEMLAILNKLSKTKGITVLMSLHDVELGLKSCESVILVKEGNLIAAGPVAEVIAAGSINRLYDLVSGNYNELLGSIELGGCNLKNKPPIFVIGGNGCGTPVYRMLARNGYDFSTGVIHENDIDYHIARAVGATVFSETAFETIGDRVFEAAQLGLIDVEMVIDCGFSTGQANQRNIELISEALKNGKTVFSLRSLEESRKTLGDPAGKLKFLNRITELETMPLNKSQAY